MKKTKDYFNDGMNYEICCFKWSDIEKHFEEIVDMQLENTYKFHYPGKNPDRNYIKRKVFEIKSHLKKNNTYFIGAKVENKLYGYIWLYESIFIDEKRMHINSFFVCEKARRTGLGQRLLDEAKKIATINGCDTISTHYADINESAGKFYFRNGFRTTRIEVVCKIRIKGNIE